MADDGGYKPFLKMDEAYNQLMQKFSKDKGRFVIELKQEHKVIGLIHLFPADNRAVWAYEIGYVINKNYRKQGYAYEAVSYVMQYCFNEVHMEMITASVFQGNEKEQLKKRKIDFLFTPSIKGRFLLTIKNIFKQSKS